MGKKRVIKKTTSGVDHELRARAVSRLPKKKLEIKIVPDKMIFFHKGHKTYMLGLYDSNTK